MSGKVIDALKEKRDKLKQELLDLQKEVVKTHMTGFDKTHLDNCCEYVLYKSKGRRGYDGQFRRRTCDRGG